MKIISGRIRGHKMTLHRIKDSKGRYVSGTVVLIDSYGKKLNLKREDTFGVEDMIMMMEVTPFKLFKMFLRSLTSSDDYKL